MRLAPIDVFYKIENIAEAFNLAGKVGMALAGRAAPALLDTFIDQR